MWILHMEIQDDIQNGHQNVNFYDNSPKILKIKVKMQILYVGLLGTNTKNIRTL